MRLTARLALGLILVMVAQTGISREADPAVQQVDEGKAPLESLRQFAEVFSRIKQAYVDEVDDDELVRYAIRGMLDGLDPHSDFLVEDDYDVLQETTKGEFGGLGIEVGMEDGFVKVVSPIDGTPADKAGVKSGDLIVRIDDHPVKGMTLNEAVDMMRGEPGSEVSLTILRDDVEAPLTLEIVRDVIHVVSVKTRLLEEAYGYVRISNFQTQTAADLGKGIERLRKQAGGELKGIILDLRNNPGGVLTGAVAVSDLFIKEGTIVYTEGRTQDANSRFVAKSDDVLSGAPLVVLVNEGSASASEIVAGALQDHRRALIIGRETFGKGSVQTVIPVDEVSAVKLTTALYYTPNGRSIQAEGIVPDIILQPVKVEVTDPAMSSVKEANLSRHLKNLGDNGDEEVTGGEVEPDESENESDEAPEELLVTEDYMLSEALNLLKGLYILGLREN